MMFGWSQKEKDAALVNAVEKQKDSRIISLLRKGANADQRIKSGHETLFMHVICSYRPNPEVIKTFLIYVKDINALDEQGKVPLIEIVSHYNINSEHKSDLLNRFRHHGANLEARDGKGRSVYAEAIEKREWTLARWMPVYIKQADLEAMRALTFRISDPPPLEIIKDFIVMDTKGDAEAETRKKNYLADMAFNAVWHDKESILDVLLKNGQPLGMRKDGRDMLAVAVKAGMPSMVEKLLSLEKEQGGHIFDHDSAFSVAIEKVPAKCAELLMSAGKINVEKAYAAAFSALQTEQENYKYEEARYGHLPWDMQMDHEVDFEGMMEAIKEKQKIIAKLSVLRDPAAIAAEEKAQREAEEKLAAEKAARMETPDGMIYKRVNPYIIEAFAGDGLTMTFNFLTRKITHRDTRNGSPMVVENFRDMERPEFIDAVRKKLIELDGNPPPEPVEQVTHIVKRISGGSNAGL